MDKPRPYWHVDLKWTSAILLAFALAGTLPVAGLYRATSEDSGRKIVAYVMAGLASPDGLDSDKGLQEVRDKVHRTGSETLDVGGVPVVVTAADVDTLSPRELRLKVFGSFAARFYDLGPSEPPVRPAGQPGCCPAARRPARPAAVGRVDAARRAGQLADRRRRG